MINSTQQILTRRKQFLPFFFIDFWSVISCHFLTLGFMCTCISSFLSRSLIINVKHFFFLPYALVFCFSLCVLLTVFTKLDQFIFISSLINSFISPEHFSWSSGWFRHSLLNFQILVEFSSSLSGRGFWYNSVMLRESTSCQSSSSMAQKICFALVYRHLEITCILCSLWRIF